MEESNVRKDVPRVITREVFNQLLGIKENYEMPQKLMNILLNDAERQRLFGALLEQEQDLSKDWFTDIFQDEHGDRDALKQDFTPDCLCTLMDRLSGSDGRYADVCAGTGGLTIKKWNTDPDGYFYCEEISSRTVPMLLLNMSIRNMHGMIVHGNSLTKQISAIYRLEKGHRFSEISCALPFTESMNFQTVIMNPPYSLKWDEVGEYKEDNRFKDFGLPPKKAADYAFVMHGLAKLSADGELFAILPHGILFRGGSEGKIREKLIRNNLIHAVIGLPDKLFAHTGIPVCIVVLKKKRSESDILFIDASKKFSKGSRQNSMESEHIEQIVKTYQRREYIERFSDLAKISQIEDNQFNLNIPRYVDTFEREPLPDLVETLLEIESVDKEIMKTEGELYRMMLEMVGTDPEADKDLRKGREIFKRNLEEKYGERFLTNFHADA